MNKISVTVQVKKAIQEDEKVKELQRCEVYFEQRKTEDREQAFLTRKLFCN